MKKIRYLLMFLTILAVTNTNAISQCNFPTQDMYSHSYGGTFSVLVGTCDKLGRAFSAVERRNTAKESGYDCYQITNSTSYIGNKSLGYCYGCIN